MIRNFIVAVSLIISPGCVEKENDAPKHRAETSWEKFILNSDDLKRNIDLANGGDAQAAKRVADHFGAKGSDHQDSYNVWIVRANDLGDESSNERLVSRHLSKGECAKAEAGLNTFKDRFSVNKIYYKKIQRRIKECRANPIGEGSWLTRNPNDFP